jgi:hypothetical protein
MFHRVTIIGFVGQDPQILYHYETVLFAKSILRAYA